MLEKEIKNSIIGTFEENGIFYVELLDKNNNIIKHNLINCLSKEENQIMKANNKNEFLYKFKIEKTYINSKEFQPSLNNLKKSINITEI